MDIREKIKEFLIKEPDFKFSYDIDDTTSLVDSGVLDSFSVIKLIVFIEKTFNIKMEIVDLTEENMSSIKNITDLIKRKTSIHTN